MTNVTGRNYGTHLPGVDGRTLCKRYAMRDVNVDGDDGRNTSCKLCLRARGGNMAKKPGLIYDSEGTIRAELLLAAAVEHEEQLRKIALFWAGVHQQNEKGHAYSVIGEIIAGLTATANDLDALSTTFDAMLPDDEDEE